MSEDLNKIQQLFKNTSPAVALLDSHADQVTGAFPYKLTVVDNMDPESLAMIQAAYSRSHEGIAEKLKSLGVENPLHAKSETTIRLRKSMQTYYLNYGHASIADCGNTTVFIEGVSMLAAKALQDTPLYNGQESSTRYIDFDNKPIISGTSEVEVKLIGACMDFYNRWLPIVTESFIELYGADLKSDEQGDKPFKNACKAAAFDIMRGWLPAGMTTQLSWTGSLRHLRERLVELRLHPLDEVRSVAFDIYESLASIYPASFKIEEMEEPITEFEAHSYKYRFYQTVAEPLKLEHGLQGSPLRKMDADNDFALSINLAGYGERIRQLLQAYNKQPAEERRNLPKTCNGLADVSLAGIIDFASYRDVQRHRTLQPTGPMPLLAAFNGFSDQYASSLRTVIAVKDARDETDLTTSLDIEHFKLMELFTAVANEQLYAAKHYLMGHNMTSLVSSRYLIDGMMRLAHLQYCLPMGTVVPTEHTTGLADFLYLARLRSGKTVHPTVRHWLRNMFRAYTRTTPSVMNQGRDNLQHELHAAAFHKLDDLDKGDIAINSFSLARGSQTFLKDAK